MEDIRWSSASPRPPCDGTPSSSVWPSPRQTPGPSCPYPSDRPPSGHRPGRRQARYHLFQIGLSLAIAQADAYPSNRTRPDATMKPVDAPSAWASPSDSIITTHFHQLARETIILQILKASVVPNLFHEATRSGPHGRPRWRPIDRRIRRVGAEPGLPGIPNVNRSQILKKWDKIGHGNKTEATYSEMPKYEIHSVIWAGAPTPRDEHSLVSVAAYPFPL